DRGEFVQNAVDLHGGDGCTPQRRQQHAAQRVAQRQAETALERLGHQRGQGLVLGLELDLVRLDQFLPVFLYHGLTFRMPATIQSWQASWKPWRNARSGRSRGDYASCS